jgi:hypothetical protein
MKPTFMAKRRLAASQVAISSEFTQKTPGSPVVPPVVKT